jgi:MFS transporter, FHS family, glucose/mannose:H+ symporter
MAFIGVSGILTFVLLGIVQSLYGPLLPGLERAFALRATTVGFVFTAHGLGALLGVLLPSLLARRARSAHWLGIASALMLLGAAAVALAASWAAVLVAVFVLAIGLGIHIVRLNALFVSLFRERGMTMSLLLNAGFSVGAILGPVVAGLMGQPTRGLFAVVALLALALFPMSVLTDRKAGIVSAASAERAPESASDGASRSGSPLLLAALVALMCLTTGVENSISGWMVTVALAQGHSFSSAANLTALFFGGIFTGRLIAASLARRVESALLVIGALSCIAILLATAIFMRSVPAGFVLSGFAIAPLFSATLVWLDTALPSVRHAHTLVVAGALLGSATLPALVGRVVGPFGPAAAAPAILCMTVVALAVAVRAHLARERRPTQEFHTPGSV